MRPTIAIVLAAGVGSRLRPLTDHLPKCLLDLGGETLLERMLRLLAEAGIRGVVVATGHLEAHVREALATSPVPVTFVANPDHAVVQNMVSLHRALAAAPPGPVLKLDGDLVFAPDVLRRVLDAGPGSLVALDHGEVDPEAMKVIATDGFARRFGKGLDPALCAGESIGLESFDLAWRASLEKALAAAVAEGRTDLYYEDVYNELLESGLPMRCVPVGDLPWTEVDDLADLERARALVAAPCPCLRAG